MKMGENILLPSIAQYCHFWEYCPARENLGFPTWVFPGGQYFANLGVDPDQTAPLGAVWSGSALFAQACLSENLGSLQYVTRVIGHSEKS